MQRVFWVVPGRLAGREGPVQAPWRLEELQAGGFQAVLSLADDQGDPRTLWAVGLVHASVPLPTAVPADEPAARDCLVRLPRTFAFLDAQLSAGRRVLVHCAAGRDRTGLVLAHYLARSERLSAEAAIARVRRSRPEVLSAAGWERLALHVIRALAVPPPPPARRWGAPAR